jgi:hypothetical protein
MMSEEDLIKLGFEKQIDNSGKKFYYYTLTITAGLEFITQADDEVIDDNWVVEVFNTDIPIIYTDAVELSVLIVSLKKHLKNE